MTGAQQADKKSTLAMEAVVAEPFKNLDDLYSNLDNLILWPEVKDLRECTEYVYRGEQADVGTGRLKKLHRDGQPKTIICHDMKGGYLEDRFINGSTAHDSYLFYHWSMIDTFIYFSHKLVTIPPYGWINAAHNHGVKILGTLISEGADGVGVWERVLSDRNETRKFADALVRLAKFYKFEGWLLNVENEINVTKIDDLIYFVNYLRESIHTEIEGSEIIWYDSVSAQDGKLNWQNELNFHNESFFDSCDGIFLNYNWSDSSLANSFAVADKSKRVFDVYVGLDVWGRGCPGGGGFNSAHALERIRRQGLSVAIFAPGWTHENFGPETFIKIENIFWSQLIPYLYVHVPIYDKEIFSTSFCRGSGLNYYRQGQTVPGITAGSGILPGNPFYNLSIQKPQILAPGLHSKFTFVDIPTPVEPKDKNAPVERPVSTFETSFETIKVNGNKISFVPKISVPPINHTESCTEDSYEGGSSLELIFNDNTRYHRLFLVHIDFDQTIEASLVYKKRQTDRWQQHSLRDPNLILGNDGGSIFLAPVETRELDSQWRKSIYFTNLRTVNEIGVALNVIGKCCVGEIVIEPMRERRDVHSQQSEDYERTNSSRDSWEYDG
ncbi:cytosolic endo-beta-N-acetylglucosaminidase isoform X2 [Venturia canescens]|nr:cytosolic endo-beta-N-acetylglucosaminidase isoform X2 [Venturia canescens]